MPKIKPLNKLLTSSLLSSTSAIAPIKQTNKLFPLQNCWKIGENSKIKQINWNFPSDRWNRESDNTLLLLSLTQKKTIRNYPE